MPQKLPALKRKYLNDDCKPLKPLANFACVMWLFTFKSLAYERLRPRIRACRPQYPTSPSMVRPTAVSAFVADRVGQHYDDVLRRAFIVASGGAV